MPRSYEWNVAVQQSLAESQAVSLTYLGAAGRRLLQPEVLTDPNANFGFVELVRNSATSDYDALQMQFQRRMTRGVQALASYTWSHSLDDGSSSSIGSDSNAYGAYGPGVNRGPSDFDFRHTFSGALSVNLPTPAGASHLLRTLLGNWSMENIFQARTAVPVNVYNSALDAELANTTDIRPDVAPGVPWYIYTSSVAGGKMINPAAFVSPPLDENGVPLREGDLGRNALRGFGFFQWDYSVRREFVLHENWRLQFRAEFFNLLNHPNFASPINDLSNPDFGLATSMLSSQLGSDVAGSGGFGFASVFQEGGPRSIQFGLKLQF
jgi:hypothetical protein